MNRRKALKIIAMSSAFPCEFLSYLQANDKIDNFPLELRKHQYEARFAKKAGEKRPKEFRKEDLEERVSACMDLEVKKQENNYIINLDSYSPKSIANIFVDFNMHIQTKLASEEKNKAQHYRVLEATTKNNYRILFFSSNETKKSTFTQNIPTLIINFLAKDYSQSGRYPMGKLKGDGKLPTDIYVNITKNNNDYVAELTLPDETLLSNKTPFKAYYKKENGKTKVSKLELFIKKFTINHWVVATPKY